tara:strand:- start:1342 stop:1653 length:312 start_codon:yes stop_codon:yes gene_type:complete
MFPLLVCIARDSVIGMWPLKKKLMMQKTKKSDTKFHSKNNKTEIKDAKRADTAINFFAKLGSFPLSANHPQKGGPKTLDHCIGDINTPISAGEKLLKFNHRDK